MEFFVLYLLVMLEQIAQVLVYTGRALVVPTLLIVGCLTFVRCGEVAIAYGSGKRPIIEANARWYKALKWPVISLVSIGTLLIVIGSLLPTPKQAAVIFGGGLAYQAVTSEKGQAVLGKLGGKVEHELDKLLGIPDEAVEK